MNITCVFRMINQFCPLARTGLSGLAASSVCTVQRALVHHHMERHDLARFLGITRSNKARSNRNTHVNEKMFRKLRGRKTVVIDLPDDEEQRRHEKLSPNELRVELLKKGINPYKEVQPRSWQEAQITIQSFYAVVDPFVTPEPGETLPFFGAGVDGLKMKGEELKQRALHRYHNWRNGTNRIRKKEGFEKFDAKTFGPTADLIYEEAHKALMKRDKPTLHKFITEHAFKKMWPDVENGSVVWELVERLEPSSVVSVRCGDQPYKSGNDIAQLTVRMHTKQKLAVYDRFGHLILGSETDPREVIEYVVFENHIAVVDGSWRLHDKVYPKWVQPKQGVDITYTLGDGSGESRPDEPSNLPLRVEEIEQQRRKEEKSGKTADEE
ncbi:Tim44-like domain protein [Necator americanus]|uniref:Large ribosomal subunit protein mL45 n=1 Tax=Necator americanus TaxID=51031 RepID=W2TDH1_NECAM|nr:Tim44-like domain protein [Necator americanus]ETN79863.1 Tim44-like domain protein [Necator americanus]